MASPTRFLTLPLSGRCFPRFPHAGAGLRHCTAGSPPHLAESRSSSYGPESHLPLLRTPPRGDALSFGYRPESACLKRTLTSLSMHARRRTERRSAAHAMRSIAGLDPRSRRAGGVGHRLRRCSASPCAAGAALLYLERRIGLEGEPSWGGRCALRRKSLSGDWPPALFADAVEYPRPESLNKQGR